MLAAKYDTYAALLEAWVQEFGSKPRHVPPTEDEFRLGYYEGRVMPLGRVDGLQGAETGYSWKSWLLCQFDWEVEARSVFKTITCGAVRCAWLYSANPGVGKTGFAIGLCREMIEHAQRSQIIRLPEMSGASWAQREKAALSIADYDLTILDDIHRIRWTSEWASDWVHAVLDSAFTHRKQVIVTSNVRYDQIVRAAGRDFLASFDRLQEGGLTEVECQGESARA